MLQESKNSKYCLYLRKIVDEIKNMPIPNISTQQEFLEQYQKVRDEISKIKTRGIMKEENLKNIRIFINTTKNLYADISNLKIRQLFFSQMNLIFAEEEIKYNSSQAGLQIDPNLYKEAFTIAEKAAGMAKDLQFNDVMKMLSSQQENLHTNLSTLNQQKAAYSQQKQKSYLKEAQAAMKKARQYEKSGDLANAIIEFNNATESMRGVRRHSWSETNDTKRNEIQRKIDKYKILSNLAQIKQLLQHNENVIDKNPTLMELFSATNELVAKAKTNDSQNYASYQTSLKFLESERDGIIRNQPSLETEELPPPSSAPPNPREALEASFQKLARTGVLFSKAKDPNLQEQVKTLLLKELEFANNTSTKTISPWVHDWKEILVDIIYESYDKALKDYNLSPNLENSHNVYQLSTLMQELVPESSRKEWKENTEFWEDREFFFKERSQSDPTLTTHTDIVASPPHNSPENPRDQYNFITETFLSDKVTLPVENRLGYLQQAVDLAEKLMGLESQYATEWKALATYWQEQIASTTLTSTTQTQPPIASTSAPADSPAPEATTSTSTPKKMNPANKHIDMNELQQAVEIQRYKLLQDDALLSEIIKIKIIPSELQKDLKVTNKPEEKKIQFNFAEQSVTNYLNRLHSNLENLKPTDISSSLSQEVEQFKAKVDEFRDSTFRSYRTQEFLELNHKIDTLCKKVQAASKASISPEQTAANAIIATLITALEAKKTSLENSTKENRLFDLRSTPEKITGLNNMIIKLRALKNPDFTQLEKFFEDNKNDLTNIAKQRAIYTRSEGSITKAIAEAKHTLSKAKSHPVEHQAERQMTPRK